MQNGVSFLPFRLKYMVRLSAWSIFRAAFVVITLARNVARYLEKKKTTSFLSAFLSWRILLLSRPRSEGLAEINKNGVICF